MGTRLRGNRRQVVLHQQHTLAAGADGPSLQRQHDRRHSPQVALLYIQAQLLALLLARFAHQVLWVVRQHLRPRATTPGKAGSRQHFIAGIKQQGMGHGWVQPQLGNHAIEPAAIFAAQHGFQIALRAQQLGVGCAVTEAL